MFPQAFLQFLRWIMDFHCIYRCEQQNKDSMTQWKFCRLEGSSTEDTDLQVLEASQGGLHPGAGARCYS